MPGTLRGDRTRSGRMLFAAAIAATVVIAASCGSDSPTGPKNVSGTYVLTTVDGLPLPFIVTNPRDHSIVINSVTATLDSSGSYAVAGTGTQDGHASTVITDAGTYSQSGATLHFTSTMFNAVYSASAKTDSVTVTLPGGFVDSSTSTFALLLVKGS
jgi:hypothetical protein